VAVQPNRMETERLLRDRIGVEFTEGVRILGQGRVRRWVLRRGMEFQSPWIWWGDVSKSRVESYGGGPHEGVDFVLAEVDAGGRIEAGLEGMRVPAFTDGRVVWCFTDLVGDTVIVATDKRVGDLRMIIQYSHIDFENAEPGQRVAAGTDIGRIKLSVNPKSITASHLHISIGLLRENLLSLPPTGVDFTNWLDWDREGDLIYLDPLEILLPEAREGLFVSGDAANSPFSGLVGTGPTQEDRVILRRILSRNFPGVRTISRLTEAEAEAEMNDSGVLVWKEGHDWRLMPGKALPVPAGQPLSGSGSGDLVEAIRSLETAGITP